MTLPLPPDLVIFDCDGVLIDSEVLSCRSDVALLAELGLHFELADYMALVLGTSAKETLARVEAATGRPLPPDFGARKAASTAAAFERELTAMPGIHAVLARVRAAGWPVCVASSSSPERLALALRLTDLSNSFGPHVYSAVQVAHGKPAPDLFWLAAGQFGARPERCVVIEDSGSGVQAAVAAGMTPIGFVGGSHQLAGAAQRLRALGAYAVIDHLDQLPPLLGV